MISDLIKTDVLPYIILKEGDKEFSQIIEKAVKEQTETLNNRIRTAAGHITNYESGLKDAVNADLVESYK